MNRVNQCQRRLCTHVAGSAAGAWHPALPWGPRSWVACNHRATPSTERHPWPAASPAPSRARAPCSLWPATAQGGPSGKLARTNPDSHFKAPNFPRNTAARLGGGHPGCTNQEPRPQAPPERAQPAPPPRAARSPCAGRSRPRRVAPKGTPRAPKFAAGRAWKV